MELEWGHQPATQVFAMEPLHPKPGRSPANRSVLRGADILRAFRPGSDVLGNGELAERTGLSPATVSRMTQTLVAAGLLQQDHARRAYRLAPLVLSLAHAMRSGSQVLATAAPLMRALAEKEHLNVGLACPDHADMVYLESIRYNRRVALRNVVSGQRVPMELTSLGRAHLATLAPEQLAPLQAVFKQRNGRHWGAIKAGMEQARLAVLATGVCWVSWQPGVLAVATPLPTAEGPCALNVSVSVPEPSDDQAQALVPALLNLKKTLVTALARQALA
jgi:DNA-binding IclR family transcriptional regulator